MRWDFGFTAVFFCGSTSIASALTLQQLESSFEWAVDTSYARLTASAKRFNDALHSKVRAVLLVLAFQAGRPSAQGHIACCWTGHEGALPSPWHAGAPPQPECRHCQPALAAG
jgi:hypothetical protein